MAITIKDIARETGYAVSTISRALNNHPDVSPEAKERIFSVVEALEFVPNSNARHLKKTETRNIAVLVKGMSNMFFIPLIEQIQELIENRKYTHHVQFIDEDENEVLQALRLCREIKPLGLIFLGGNNDAFKKDFGKIDLPSVLITNPASQLGFPNLSSVYTDDVSGAEVSMRFLVEKGHRYIGIIGGHRHISYTSELRYKGCLKVLDEYGISFDPAKQFRDSRYSFSSAYKQMTWFLDEFPEITAVLAMSDVMAIGAIRAILDRGLKTPEDISVIGYDGTTLASYYNPKLATVQQSQKQLAARGVEILLDCIENDTPAVHEEIPFTFIDGESVSRPR